MNFSSFRQWRGDMLHLNPGVMDCGETNLYRTLASLQGTPIGTDSERPVHRCDLSRAWLRRYGFAEALSRQALVCCGVRHALSVIFSEIAGEGSFLWLPSDVYPVYFELAGNAGLDPKSFPTLPSPRLPCETPIGHPEYLLVANPWKPLGRYITEEECRALISWVEAAARRRLILDCAYDFEAPFHSTTRRLWDTGRSLLLHSVTKGWLKPKTFGVALLPEELPRLQAAFRAEPPSQQQLATAEALIATQPELPGQIAAALALRRRTLLAALPAPVRERLLLDSAVLAAGCYFFAVAMSAEQLLSLHRIVALPASVFGDGWGGSVMTSLGQDCAPNENGGCR